VYFYVLFLLSCLGFLSHGNVVQWLVGALRVQGCSGLVEELWCIVDCAPDSKEYNIKCDLGVLRDASETPCKRLIMVTMVTMGDDLQPGCLADRLLTGLGQPQINP